MLPRTAAWVLLSLVVSLLSVERVLELREELDTEYDIKEHAESRKRDAESSPAMYHEIRSLKGLMFTPVVHLEFMLGDGCTYI